MNTGQLQTGMLVKMDENSHHYRRIRHVAHGTRNSARLAGYRSQVRPVVGMTWLQFDDNSSWEIWDQNHPVGSIRTQPKVQQ